MNRIYLTKQECAQIVCHINSFIQDDEEVLSISMRYIVGLLVQCSRSGAPLCLDPAEFSILRSVVNDSSLNNIKEILNLI